MRRLASTSTRALLLLLLLLLAPLSVGCSGGRDARDVASDVEGTVSAEMVDRVLHDVDLEKNGLTVTAEPDVQQRFESGQQQDLESFLRAAANDYQGDKLHVTQQVEEDHGDGTSQLTLTISVEHEGQTRYVPVVLDLLRDGKRILVTRARVMASTR